MIFPTRSFLNNKHFHQRQNTTDSYNTLLDLTRPLLALEDPLQPFNKIVIFSISRPKPSISEQ